uniref:GSTd1 n=1 Tax=Liposcelis entomophila TaxID=550478 RepID=A0A1J0F4S0_9NEOP|nr:GSTd1 [Liposcelis entomophila]
MGKVEVHGLLASPPTRAVVITCEILGIPYELKQLDPMNKSPEFKKLTAQQQIPVLVDDGFALPESRAIMQYLADKYGKDDSLYPKDLKARAVVNARLNFDNGTLWPRLIQAYRPTFSGGQVDEEGLKSLLDSMGVIEEFLTREKWVAGPKMTLADISFSGIICILTVPEVKFDMTPFPKVKAWIEECRKNPILKKYDDLGVQQTRERMAMLREKFKQR